MEARAELVITLRNGCARGICETMSGSKQRVWQACDKRKETIAALMATHHLGGQRSRSEHYGEAGRKSPRLRSLYPLGTADMENFGLLYSCNVLAVC